MCKRIQGSQVNRVESPEAEVETSFGQQSLEADYLRGSVDSGHAFALWVKKA